jgi:hypothetical protein
MSQLRPAKSRRGPNKKRGTEARTLMFSWSGNEPLIHISTATDQDRSGNVLRDPDEGGPEGR